MEFQNTIAYGQFYNAGGVVAITTSYVALAFTPIVNLAKNIHIANVFGVYVEQTGSYFLDFSFIAEDGDGVVYSFAPFINGVEQLGSIDFYQQATTQEYEVGSNYIFDLTEGDFISFKVKTASVSATAFIIKDIKLNIFNLQQLGIH